MISTTSPLLASMLAGALLTAPAHAWQDVEAVPQPDADAQKILEVPETSTLTASELGGEFALPVIVIQGAEDFTTPTSLAETFAESIRAPGKWFVRIEGGHFAVFTNPDGFLKELLAVVAR